MGDSILYKNTPAVAAEGGGEAGGGEAGGGEGGGEEDGGANAAGKRKRASKGGSKKKQKHGDSVQEQFIRDAPGAENREKMWLEDLAAAVGAAVHGFAEELLKADALDTVVSAALGFCFAGEWAWQGKTQTKWSELRGELQRYLVQAHGKPDQEFKGG
eukprot:5648588-Alexandrium_andersonii.AAC.1